MTEQYGKILNPTLALIKLYKKDGKTFDDMIRDITAHMNSLGIILTDEYIKDKVLPWTLSFLFMTTSHQMLDEYIQNLSKQTTK